MNAPGSFFGVFTRFSFGWGRGPRDVFLGRSRTFRGAFCSLLPPCQRGSYGQWSSFQCFAVHVFHRQGRRGGGVKRDKRKTFGFVGHPILSDVDADDRTKSIEQIGQFNVGNLEREVAHEYFGSTTLFLFGQGNPRFCFGEVEKFHFLVVLGDFGQWVGWGGVAIEVTGSVWVELVVRCTRGQVLSMHWSV